MAEAAVWNRDERDGAQRYYWDRYAATTVGRYLLSMEVEFVRRSLDTARRPARVLDIACGSGRLSRPLCGLGFTVVALDSSALALAAFRRAGAERCALVEGDAHKLPFPDASMDRVGSKQASMLPGARAIPGRVPAHASGRRTTDHQCPELSRPGRWSRLSCGGGRVGLAATSGPMRPRAIAASSTKIDDRRGTTLSA